MPTRYPLFKVARARPEIYGRDVIWPASPRIGLAEIEKVVDKEYGLSTGELRSTKTAAREAKKVMLELAGRYSGKCQREIGHYLGYTSDSTVGQQRQVLRRLIETNSRLKRQMAKLCERLERQ